jgi:hypothetical protein
MMGTGDIFVSPQPSAYKQTLRLPNKSHCAVTLPIPYRKGVLSHHVIVSVEVDGSAADPPGDRSKTRPGFWHLY